MSYIFYKIVFNNRTYLGELSETTENGDFFKFHCKHAIPWETSKTKNTNDESTDTRWENDLWSAINNNGLKETFNNIQCYAISAENCISSIISSMNNYCQTHKETCFYSNGQEFYNDIVSLFGIGSQRAEILVPEMLLILLQSKTSDMWNLHANYGTRSGRISWDSMPKILSVDTVKKREDSYRINIWYTFELDSLPDQIELVAKALVGTNKIKFDVNNLQNREALKKINKVVKDTTMDSFKKQINNTIKTLEMSKDENRKEIAQELNDIVATLESQGYGQKGSKKQLRTMLDDFNKMYKKRVSKTIKTEIPTLQRKIATLQDWISSADIPTFPSVSPSLNWFKEDFTNYVATLCFSGTPDTDYQYWKMEHQYLWDEEGEAIGVDKYRPGAFYPTYLRREKNSKWDGLSLREKLYTTVSKSQYNYLKNNWYNIYPEQIAIYLTKNGWTFAKKVDNYFINTMDVENINYF